MTWLKDEGFGGIMIWSVDMDDFRGSCGTGKYPLMTAMRQELDGYKVKLEYEGPFEGTSSGAGAYTTKDRKYKCMQQQQTPSQRPRTAWVSGGLPALRR